MPALTPITRQILEKLFLPEYQQEAVELLETECGYKKVLHYANEAEMQRIRLGVLRLSKGDIDELIMAISLAQTDFRDLIRGARFGDPTASTLWADGVLSGTIEPELMPTGIMEAAVFQSTWVKCPNCGWRFTITEPSSWTGKRHRRCGQLIELKMPEA